MIRLAVDESLGSNRSPAGHVVDVLTVPVTGVNRVTAVDDELRILALAQHDGLLHCAALRLATISAAEQSELKPILQGVEAERTFRGRYRIPAADGELGYESRSLGHAHAVQYILAVEQLDREGARQPA